ncbi:hypothetical protein D3C73_1518320 [compost metagenome]
MIAAANSGTKSSGTEAGTEGDVALDDATAVKLRRRVTALAEKFPLYPHLSNNGNGAATATEAELIGAAQ